MRKKLRPRKAESRRSESGKSSALQGHSTKINKLQALYIYHMIETDSTLVNFVINIQGGKTNKSFLRQSFRIFGGMFL